MPRAHIGPPATEPQPALPLRGMTAWDRTAIIMLGAAGFAFSYDALRQIAIAIHARETLSYLFPVFIDGFIAYGVRAIVLLRHRPFFARLYTWFLFLAATAASLGSNALHAITLNHGPQSGRSALHLTDGVVGVLSTLAPLALAGSVHLYILMARSAELSVRDGADGGPGPVRMGIASTDGSAHEPESAPVEVRAAAETPDVAATPSAAVGTAGPGVDLRKPRTEHSSEPPSPDRSASPSAAADRAGEELDQADGPAAAPADHEASTPPSAPAEPSVQEPVRSRADGKTPPVPDDTDLPREREADDEWLEDLLPIARSASKQAGRISRDAVKEAVRAQQPISNDRLGVLLARLKEEEEQAAKTPVGSSSALW